MSWLRHRSKALLFTTTRNESPTSSQLNPAVILSNLGPIFISSSHLRGGHPSRWALYLRLPHQNPTFTSSLLPRVLHSSRVHRSNNIWRPAQIMELLITSSSPLPCYLVPLRPKYLPHTLFPNTLSLCSSLYEKDHVLHKYKNKTLRKGIHKICTEW